jgi:Leucine-rich repeat (LRR) protein
MRYLKKYKKNTEITFKEYLDIEKVNIDIYELFCSHSNLIDLNGIEEFKNLRYIDCSNNELTELPDLSNLKGLENIRCSENNLSKLPDLSSLTELTNLSCFDNNLTELPDLSNLTKLESLYCQDNKLTELPDLTNLKYLVCFNNNLPFKCRKDSYNLEEYLEWHKKEYPWVWDAKKYNL